MLGGRAWEGTFTGTRGDGSWCSSGCSPCRRGPSGDIDGMVVLVTEAGRRDAQREQDRLRLLERIGERLAGSLELDTTLRHVAQILVPQFADHCFIDLFSGDKLDQAGRDARRRLGAAAGNLGAGRRAHPLPARPLHAAGHGAARDDRRSRPARRVLPGAQRGVHVGGRPGRADLGAGLAAVRARRTARRDVAGAVQDHRPPRPALRPVRRRPDRRDRQPCRRGHRQRHALRGRAADRARLPAEPAAAGGAGTRRPRGRVPLRAREAARDRRGRESRRRWAGTGTTSSRSRRAGSAWSSGTWRAAGRGRRPPWGSSAPRCAPTPRTRRRPRTSCASWTSGSGPPPRPGPAATRPRSAAST